MSEASKRDDEAPVQDSREVREERGPVRIETDDELECAPSRKEAPGFYRGARIKKRTPDSV